MDGYQGLNNADDFDQFSDDDVVKTSDDPRITGGFSGRNIFVDELGSDFKKCVKIDKNLHEDYYEDEEEEEDEDITEALLAQMGYAKTGPPKHEPPATPLSAENLKSAMKSNCKKEGLPDKELKVTWAPDVFDPAPSSSNHFATNRIQRHRSENKKSGKNRQKGGGKGAGGAAGGVTGRGGGAKGGRDKDKKKQASVGGGGGSKGGKVKDKKQVKKYGGSASKCFDSLDEDETVV